MCVRPHRVSAQLLSRRGSSLIELLVVVGIIAILIAILLPMLSSIRVAARRTVCSSRLRDLSLACIQYREDHGRFPQAQSRAIPHQIELRLVNQLAPYLCYPTVEAEDPASRLPLNVQCPFVEEIETERGPTTADVDAGGAEYYTGYMYLAGLEQFAINKSADEMNVESGTSSVAVLLKPTRAARARESRRAVIWADDLHLTLSPQMGWHYAHPYVSWMPQAMAFAGQHRAFTDASVEWHPKEKLDIQFDLEKEKENPGRGRKKLREAASFVVSDTYYWW